MEKERAGKIRNKSEERSGKNEVGNFKFGEKMLQIFDRIFQFSGICIIIVKCQVKLNQIELFPV